MPIRIINNDTKRIFINPENMVYPNKGLYIDININPNIDVNPIIMPPMIAIT